MIKHTARLLRARIRAAIEAARLVCGPLGRALERLPAADQRRIRAAERKP
jgi:hypothetical protein